MKLLVALESENFPAQRRALRSTGRPAGDRLGSATVPPRALLEAAGGGVLLVDWAAGRVESRVDAPMPSGLARPTKRGAVVVACQYPAELRCLDPLSGRTLCRWHHPLFNDLHRLAPREDGGVVVVSSGTDSIVALDAAGREVWTWCGDATVNPTHNHAREARPTLSRAVHPISIAPTSDGRVLVTSFHAGTVFPVGPDGALAPVYSGLRQPHGLVASPDGWLVADTGRGRILALSRDFSRTRVVASGFRWLQDLLPLPGGGLLALENRDFRNRGARGGPRLLELDAAGQVVARMDFEADWRLAAMIPCDPTSISWPVSRVRCRKRTQAPGSAT